MSEQDFTNSVIAADEMQDRIAALERENTRLQAWVNDLQSGMYVNCVYCGHRYGPDPGTPVAMADVLKKHIEQCPKHPMSSLRALVRDLAAALREAYNGLLFSKNDKAAIARASRAKGAMQRAAEALK